MQQVSVGNQSWNGSSDIPQVNDVFYGTMHSVSYSTESEYQG